MGIYRKLPPHLHCKKALDGNHWDKGVGKKLWKKAISRKLCKNIKTDGNPWYTWEVHVRLMKKIQRSLRKLLYKSKTTETYEFFLNEYDNKKQCQEKYDLWIVEIKQILFHFILRGINDFTQIYLYENNFPQKKNLHCPKNLLFLYVF